MDRTILHCDLNSYYASVELLSHPELREVPMAVCGDPEGRHGIILAKNEPAKRYGVVTAETIWQAKRKCPGLVLLAPHRELYQEYYEKINQLYLSYTDQVEAFSIDESWLDVTGSLHLFGSGKEIADQLREKVRRQFGLTISVGVSFNKTYAKMGSDYKKPDATTVISRENYRELLFPLPVERLIYVGAAAGAVLRRHGIKTIGDLAAAPKETIVRLIGKAGDGLWNCARGMDDSPVRRWGEEEQAKSVGNGETYPRDLKDLEDQKAALMLLAESVAYRLRRLGLACQTVTLQMKDPDLKVISRQMKTPRPTNMTREIYETAFALMTASWQRGAPIRMMTVTASRLFREDEPIPCQLSLFDAPPARNEKLKSLEGVIDQVRERYGKSAVSLGRVLSQDLAKKEKAAGEK